MLETYSGTPGSGKSYHIVKEMIWHLKRGGVVVTNLELDIKAILKYHNSLTKKDLDESPASSITNNRANSLFLC